MVGLPVFSNQTGTVNRKDYMQVLHSHILKDLIKATLQKGGVNGNNRHHALLGKTASHGYRMLFGNAYIKCPCRIGFHKVHQSGALRHCCSYSTQFWIFGCKLHHGLTKLLGEGFAAGVVCLSGLRVKVTNSVELGRIGFCRLIALALLCVNMNQDGLIHILGQS